MMIADPPKLLCPQCIENYTLATEKWSGSRDECRLNINREHFQGEGLRLILFNRGYSRHEQRGLTFWRDDKGESLMGKVSMTVNGKSVSGSIEGRTLLVDFLRNDLQLTGTHVGCDTSQCGACIVHVDGVSIKSCSMFAAEAEGAEVTTIEGMAHEDGSLGVIQEAFRNHHGLQCGFCTPGMVMTAAALLKENPKPSEADVRAYLEGNICRCTGYHNIVRAILAATGQEVSEESSVHV